MTQGSFIGKLIIYKMKNLKSLSIYSMILLIACFYSFTACSDGNKSSNGTLIETEETFLSPEDLKSNVRKLMEEHILWTRNLLFCEIDSLPGKEQTLKRLLQNQADISEALSPFYGESSATEFTNLLYPHVLIYIEVIDAEKSRDVAAQEDAHLAWYKNADEISLFLSRLNPEWKLEDIKILMNDHLNLKEDIACQRILGNYDSDIKAYDELHKQVLIMADLLSAAIIKQFHEKFMK